MAMLVPASYIYQGLTGVINRNHSENCIITCYKVFTEVKYGIRRRL